MYIVSFLIEGNKHLIIDTSIALEDIKFLSVINRDRKALKVNRVAACFILSKNAFKVQSLL